MLGSLDAGKWADPTALAQEAKALFRAPAPAAADENSAEAAIRRAHEQVSPDLYVIEQCKAAGVSPNYANLFSRHYHEKIAALIFLTKHKLLDIEQSTAQSRDTEDARRDLASYVEILFHLQATDALRDFYDFACVQRDSRVPWLWRNVASRCLYLMALMLAQDARKKVIAFLAERPEAWRMLNELAQATAQEISRAFHELAREYQTTVSTPGFRLQQFAPEPYLQFANAYEREAPAGSAAGLTSLLTAQDRIRQATEQGDLPMLANWIAEGSPVAMQTAMQQAVALLPTEQYVAVMEMALQHPEMDPVRKSAIVMELGTMNRAMAPRGGLPLVNRVLTTLAETSDEPVAGLARLAVRELASVNAIHELQVIVEQAFAASVAEEAMALLITEGRLPQTEALIRSRPDLQPAFQRQRKRYLEVRSLMEAACSCPSPEMAAFYLEQLYAMRAASELEQISALPSDVGQRAREMLAKLRDDEQPDA